MGAGLWSCGNALSTEEIWGSDSRLVLLLHNQFAVWIPLHKTRNTHSPLDSAQSLTCILHPPISLLSIFHLLASLFLRQNPQMLNLCHYKQLPHDAVQKSLLFFCRLNSLDFFFCFSATNHSKICTNCLFGHIDWTKMMSNYNRKCVHVFV